MYLKRNFNNRKKLKYLKYMMCIENVFMKWYCYRLNKFSVFDGRFN